MIFLCLVKHLSTVFYGDLLTFFHKSPDRNLLTFLLRDLNTIGHGLRHWDLLTDLLRNLLTLLPNIRVSNYSQVYNVPQTLTRADLPVRDGALLLQLGLQARGALSGGGLRALGLVLGLIVCGALVLVLGGALPPGGRGDFIELFNVASQLAGEEKRQAALDLSEDCLLYLRVLRSCSCSCCC